MDTLTQAVISVPPWVLFIRHCANNLRAYYSALAVGSHNYYEGRVDDDLTPFENYFCMGMADAFSKVRGAAENAKHASPTDQSATLRELDPRQRRLLELFRKQGSATAAEMAAHLKMSPRTLVNLCRDWIASGFIEYQSAARKNRSYKLSERFHKITI